MAKRLNKKVALIGSMVVLFLIAGVIVVILRLGGDPYEYIKDGDLALESARQSDSEEVKTKAYSRGASKYLKAMSLTKDDNLQIEILFKLVDLYIETDQWEFVQGCWGKIVSIDSQNIRARYGLLSYFAIMGDTGVPVWSRIETDANDFISDISEEYFGRARSAWETPGLGHFESGGDLLGSFVYFLRGLSIYEITKSGARPNPEADIARSVSDFEKVLEYDPCNIEAYKYLAALARFKGKVLESQGDLGAEDRNQFAD